MAKYILLINWTEKGIAEAKESANRTDGSRARPTDGRRPRADLPDNGQLRRCFHSGDGLLATGVTDSFAIIFVKLKNIIRTWKNHQVQ